VFNNMPARRVGPAREHLTHSILQITWATCVS